MNTKKAALPMKMVSAAEEPVDQSPAPTQSTSASYPLGTRVKFTDWAERVTGESRVMTIVRVNDDSHGASYLVEHIGGERDWHDDAALVAVAR